MAELTEKHTIEGPFPDLDPLDTARLFLRTNGYTLSTTERQPRPEVLLHQPLARAPDEPVDSANSSDSGAVVTEVAVGAAADDTEEPPPSEERDNDDSASDSDAVVSADTEEPASDDVDDEVISRLVATRGTKWGGVFSSAMSDLHTTLTLTLVGNTVIGAYVVNTTGQLLNEEDRTYWRKEWAALEAYLKGSDVVVNILSEESARASATRRELLTSGFWIAAVLFVVIFVAGVFLLR